MSHEVIGNIFHTSDLCLATTHFKTMLYINKYIGNINIKYINICPPRSLVIKVPDW